MGLECNSLENKRLDVADVILGEETNPQCQLEARRHKKHMMRKHFFQLMDQPVML